VKTYFIALVTGVFIRGVFIFALYAVSINGSDGEKQVDPGFPSETYQESLVQRKYNQ
jgi:hypothetical protein